MVTTLSGTFGNCPKLKNITFEGLIPVLVDFSASPLLTKESIISIINALSPNKSGLTVTFKKEAVNREFGINVDDLSTYPEGSDYYKLRWSKGNWDFNYVE